MGDTRSVNMLYYLNGAGDVDNFSIGFPVLFPLLSVPHLSTDVRGDRWKMFFFLGSKSEQH